MPQVSLNEIQPGMLLAEEVYAPDGRLLLPQGAELTEKHIDFLRRTEIIAINIQLEISELDLEKAAAYAERFFLYVDHGNPIMNILFDVAVKRTALKFAEGWEAHELDPRIATNNDSLSDIFLRDEGNYKDLVKHEESIASFPDIYFRLKEVLHADCSDAKAIAAIINTDPGLSSKLLKLVNSSFYSLPTAVSTVERAVSLIGENELSTLVMGISAIYHFKDIPAELIDMRQFWKHSLSCGLLSSLIASKGKLPVPELLFTAGLLHDIGRLILFKHLPHASVQALLHAKENFLPLVEAEELVFGFTHTQVGQALMQAWRFPKILWQIIAGHHEPETADSLQKQAAVLQLADCIANALDIPEGTAFVIPHVSMQSIDLIGITLEDISQVIQEFDAQFADTAGSFL